VPSEQFKICLTSWYTSTTYSMRLCLADCLNNASRSVQLDNSLDWEVPFGILQYIKCILHGFTSVLLCVPFIEPKVLIRWLHLMASFACNVNCYNFYSGYFDCWGNFKQLLICIATLNITDNEKLWRNALFFRLAVSGLCNAIFFLFWCFLKAIEEPSL